VTLLNQLASTIDRCPIRAVRIYEVSYCAVFACRSSSIGKQVRCCIMPATSISESADADRVAAGHCATMRVVSVSGEIRISRANQ